MPKLAAYVALAAGVFFAVSWVWQGFGPVMPVLFATAAFALSYGAILVGWTLLRADK